MITKIAFIVVAVIILSSCSKNQHLNKSQMSENIESTSISVESVYKITDETTNSELTVKENIVATVSPTEAKTEPTSSITTEAPPKTEPTAFADSLSSSTAVSKGEAGVVTTGLCSLPEKKDTSNTTTVASENIKEDSVASDQDEEVLIDEDNISLEIGVAITAGSRIISEQFKDYIIVGEEYGKVYYINVSNDSTWNQREYIKGELLMSISEVSSERDLAELESGTASLLAVGTDIYKCENEPMMLLADVDGALLPYYKMVEG